MKAHDRSIIVSLIGRPNVGKSSLFNRLMKNQTKAIAYNEPGVTRDRHYGITRFDDQAILPEQEVVLVDTGGFYPQQIDESKEQRKNAFFNRMREHAKMAIEESDLVLFIVDIREGLLPFDEDICHYLRKSKKKFWLILNKYDSSSQDGAEFEFYNLGMDPADLFLVSSAHGRGVGELRERIQSFSHSQKENGLEESNLQKGIAPKNEVIGRVAIIGAPNAGKSTLLNSLLGEARALVSDIPGTTMDPIEGYIELHIGKYVNEIDQHKGRTRFNEDFIEQYETFRKNHPELSNQMHDSFEDETDIMDGSSSMSESDIFEDEQGERELSQVRSLYIVDTAGIRKKAKIDDVIESQSVYRSLRSITDSDVVLYMVDITKGITHHDKRLIDVAFEKGKSVIILLNKFDLYSHKLRNQKEIQEFLGDTRTELSWLNSVDIIPISAMKEKGLGKLFKVLKKTIFVRKVFLPTSDVNRAFFHLVNQHSVLIKGGRAKKFKIKYASQVKSNPPTFLLFANRALNIPENYKRYLKNGVKTLFGIKNTPIHLVIRTTKDLSKKGDSTLHRGH